MPPSSSPLRRKRNLLDVSAILARQAAGSGGDAGLPIQPPTALVPAYTTPGSGVQYGPNVTVNTPNTGNAADYGLAGADTRAGPPVGPDGTPLNRPTESATIQGQNPVAPQVGIYGFGQAPQAEYVNPPADQPTSSSSRPSGQYSTVGDIFAEPPPQSQDPQEWWAFHQDRFRKIANHYGMDPRAVAEQEALLAGQIALTPGLTAPQVAQLWEAAEKNLVATNDFTPDQSMQPSASTQDTMLTGTDGGNPLARYGVYTPEQTAAIQAAIGQYVTGVSDKYARQTGFKADPQTQQAYMMQAQALPAINALEGQQRLAQQVYDLEDQVRYYQALQQTGQLVPQQSTATDTSASDTTDYAALIAKLTGG